jgi:hypothetical protein
VIVRLFSRLFKFKNLEYHNFSNLLLNRANPKSLVVSFFCIFLCFILNSLGTFLSNGLFFYSIFFILTFIGISHAKANLGLIPNIRFLFLVSPGFIQLLIWFYSDDNFRIAFLGNDYLNSDIIKKVALVSTLAGASSLLGFSVKPISFKFKLITNINIYKKKYAIFFILFILFALLYTNSIGNSLLDTGGYGAGDNDSSSDTSIGVWNVFYFFFISLFYYIVTQEYSIKKSNIVFYTFIFYVTIIFIALRGVRQDSLGVILALIVIEYQLLNLKNNTHYTSLFGFIFAWFGTFLTGIIRSDFSLATIQNLPGLVATNLIKVSNQYLIINLDTASMTIGTLNVIPYKIIEKGYLFGASYLEWIPRTLPAFIYPNRPQDLSFQMQYSGEWFGWGGIHEVGEAFWNFGLIGAFIVPFFISYFMNSFGKLFLKSRSLFSAIPLVWLIMLPRFIWYQSFSFYKSTIVILIIICSIYAFRLISRKDF